MKHILIRLLGHTATILHLYPCAADRWAWLKSKIPRNNKAYTLVDVGCGAGEFTIGAALRGYRSLGLSWDEENTAVANELAGVLNAEVEFEITDIRCLDQREDLREAFDVVACLELVEHILDDRKLIIDIASMLKPGGYLYLTTPYLRFNETIGSVQEMGPWPTVETGPHVRRGYTKAMLQELCDEAGLILEHQSFCTGFVSQKLTHLQLFLERYFGRYHRLVWYAILPLHSLMILDRFVTDWFKYPYYTICVEVYKPRFSETSSLKAVDGTSNFSNDESGVK